MSAMTYKGYSARVAFDERDDVFVGRVIGLRDAISFHATTVRELRSAFKVAIDDYLASCAERGEKPNKPYSGKLMLRVPPEVHAAAAVAAESSGASLNQWAAKVLNETAAERAAARPRDAEQATALRVQDRPVPLADSPPRIRHLRGARA